MNLRRETLALSVEQLNGVGNAVKLLINLRRETLALSVEQEPTLISNI